MNRLLINGIIIVLAIATGIALSIRPWQVFHEQRSAADKTISEMRAAELRRSKLNIEQAKWDSQTGKEELARDKGYIKKGETPIVVE